MTPPPLPKTASQTPSRISAAHCIFAIAFFYTLIPLAIIIVAHINGDSHPDLFGRVFMSIWILFAVANWCAGILLYKKSRIGLYIWWVVSVLVLLNFPLGTLLGGLAYMYLSRPDAREDLKRQNISQN